MIKDREAGRNRRAYKVQPRGHIGYLVRYCAFNIYRIWVPVLDRVIITRNVIFDEDILYDKACEQLEGQPIEIAREVVELIEEDKIQDARSIFENIRLWNNDLLERSIGEPINLGGGAQLTKNDELSSITDGHDSGVGSATITSSIGLMTPNQTPEPESMPGPQRSRDNRGTELLQEPSVLGEVAKVLSDLISEAHTSNKREGRSLPRDRA